ncbi:MAG: DUF3108 domain-containing protein [Deltaproteobacteria bacterium]|nr:DUF3108 domain-containing protein [Deltaproteobacteria bacterium]
MLPDPSFLGMMNAMRSLSVSVCGLLASSIAMAQTAVGPAQPELPAVGEELTYAVDFAGVVGAYLKLKVGEGPAAQPGSRVLTAYIASTPMVQQVWRIRDKIMALYLPGEGRTAATRLWEDENGRRLFREETYEANRVSVSERRAEGSRTFEVAAEQPVLDVFSTLFELRRRPLVEGSVEKARVYISRKVYEVDAKITREPLEYRGSEVPAIKVAPALKHKGKTVSDVRFCLWFSDDEQRKPLRIEADISYGKLAGTLLPANEITAAAPATPGPAGSEATATAE